MEKLPLIETKKKTGFFQLYLCNPKHLFHRAIILCLTCLITFGSFFCYDNPAALQNMFMKDLNLSYESYMSLYAWYSWPNIVMSVIGGFLIDTVLGIRHGTIIFAMLTIIGQLLLALGAYMNELWLMDFARCVFGMGAESLAVAQNTYAAMWFRDKELNIVFGLQISISRLGSTINTNTMPILYNYMMKFNEGKISLTYSLLIASFTCIFSFLICVILGYLDRRALKMNNSNSVEKSVSIFRFSDILKFCYGFWSLCIICVFFYSSVFPFVSLAQTFFVYKYEMNIVKANIANSFIYIVSAVVSPIFGFAVDYIGRNLIWLIIGLMLLLSSHILIGFTDIEPYFITISMGFAYSIVASSLWGLVTYMVPRKNQGTAFGIMQALMNFGLGVIALISGAIVDKCGFFILELFFIACMMTSISMFILLFYWNIKNDGILNMSAKERCNRTK